MGGLVIFCGLGLLIGLICLNVYIAKKFEAVANEKGFYGFFHICFWLGAVGYILVAALPDRGNEKKTSDVQLPPL